MGGLHYFPVLGMQVLPQLGVQHTALRRPIDRSSHPNVAAMIGMEGCRYLMTGDTLGTASCMFHVSILTLMNDDVVCLRIFGGADLVWTGALEWVGKNAWRRANRFGCPVATGRVVSGCSGVLFTIHQVTKEARCLEVVQLVLASTLNPRLPLVEKQLHCGVQPTQRSAGELILFGQFHGCC
jgi:hypothetical protein